MSRPVYTPEQRDHALALLRAGGRLGDVQAATGIPKTTLSRWSRKAGIDTSHAQSERTSNASRMAALSYTETVAELNQVLGKLARLGARAQLERLQALFPSGPGGEADLEALKGEDLAKLVGVTTRAIHDLQLLSGHATSRVDQGSEVDRRIEQLLTEFERRELAGSTAPSEGGA